MAYRTNGIVFSFLNIGEGQVNKDSPPDDLLPTESFRISGPTMSESKNMSLQDNIARVRSGYQLLVTAGVPVRVDTGRVVGLFPALFDNGTRRLVRIGNTENPGGGVTIQQYDGTVWNDMIGASGYVPTSDFTRYWNGAMVTRTGTVNPKNQFMGVNGADKPFVWIGSGDLSIVTGAPTGTKNIVSFLNRAFHLNTTDTSGNRRNNRIHWSNQNDPTNYTGLSSGFADLDNDPFPIQGGVVAGGGCTLYKGDENGGSLVRLTPTGNPFSPIRVDSLNAGNGIGILLPRSLIQLRPGMIFFVGHDGLYLHDGLGGLQSFGENITKHILNRLNYEALDAALAWYRPISGEIHIGIPTGANTTANEVWVVKLRDRRVYGPYEYGENVTASGSFVITASTTWNSLEGLTWDALPWDTWDEIGGVTGAQSWLYGTTTGRIMVDDNIPGTNDNGIAVVGNVIIGPVGLAGRSVRTQTGTKEYASDDLVTLRDITVRYEAASPWIPVVEYRMPDSADRGTEWTTLSDGVEVPAAGGKMQQVTYSTANSPVTASSFEFRIGGQYARISGVFVEVTHAGRQGNDQ